VPVSFDLFGTLVRVDGPDEPATAVATALVRRGVSTDERVDQQAAQNCVRGSVRSLYAETTVPETSADAEHGVVTDLDTEVRQP